MMGPRRSRTLSEPPPVAIALNELRPSGDHSTGLTSALDNNTALPQRRTNNAEAVRRDHAKKALKEKSVSELWDDYVFNAPHPTFAFIAIGICLVGVINPITSVWHDPSIWPETLEDVDGSYGPGLFLSWFLTWLSALYDANHDHNTFHYMKYTALFVTSVGAMADCIWRAQKNLDFGPSYAAASYTSDKAFEFAVLFYCIRTFEIRRTRRNTTDETTADEAQRPQSLVKQSRIYGIVPCIIMIAAWGYARALSNGHDTWRIDAQNPPGLDGSWYSWKPLLDTRWRWLIAPSAALPFLLIGKACRYPTMSWGLPLGILAAFASLHSGLWGGYTGLRMTAKSMTEIYQWAPLAATVLVLACQYLYPPAKKLWEKLERPRSAANQSSDGP